MNSCSFIFHNQTFTPSGKRVVLIMGKHSSKASPSLLISMFGHTILWSSVYNMIPPQSSSFSGLICSFSMTERVHSYSSRPVLSFMNFEKSFSIPEIIPLMSFTSSSLQQIYKDGSSSLIIPCMIKFLRVSKYLFLFDERSCFNFSFIFFFISSMQLFLSFIFSNLAAKIFCDL